jgi:hypothetical protein
MRLSLILFLTLLVSACQSNSATDFDIDRDCTTKKVGSKFLAKATGVGLGLAGIPGGGLAGRGVALATDPRCQAVRPKLIEQDKKLR